MRFFFYMFVVVVFGALTYLIVTLVVGLTLWLTASAVGAWSGEFEDNPPRGVLGTTVPEPVVDTQNVAAWWVGIWSGCCSLGRWRMR